MSWDPIDLSKLEPRPKTLPTIGGVDLVYPGKRHVFSGPPESAKTLGAYAIGLEEIRQGSNVLLIDFEMGPWDARDRLREMGATDEDLERLLYVEPELPASEAIVDEIATQWTFSLAIIDAAAGAYALQGLDDNHRRDVEHFARLYVEGFWRREIATIVLDHVGKNKDKRGQFAIGSERKVGGADVHLGFEAVLPITRGGRGLYKITTHKDRLGHLARPKAADLEFRSDASTGALTWTFRAAEAPVEDARWRPTMLMQRVSEYLEGLRPEERDAVSRREVVKSVRGKDEWVRVAVDALITDGYVSETAGTRGSRLVRSLKPFREDDCVPPRPDRVPDAVDHSSSDRVPRSPSLEGDAVTDAVNGSPDADFGEDDLERWRALANDDAGAEPAEGGTT